MTELVIAAIGPQHAAELRPVVQAAFAARPVLDPPAAALAETEESLAQALTHGGLIARLGPTAVGGHVFDPVVRDDGRWLFIRRFGVDPAHQGHGVAHRLVQASVPHALGHDGLAVLVREELPRNVGFWADNGFVETGRNSPYIEMRRPTPQAFTVTDGEAMRDLGRTLGSTLRAGDLVILSGELGAGKTTFTQGLGDGLGVRGGITSPTFVIARVHPSLVGGPDLVHVDAYRLGGVAELDDLDLDTSLEEAVTVVEWGEGLAETLAERRLGVHIARAVADEASDADERVVTFGWV